MVVGIAGASATLLATLSLFIPQFAGAFWPFSNARAEGGESPILHDPSLDLLEAARNIDPNPSKGGTLLSLSEGSALVASAGPEGTIPEPGTHASGGTISTYTVKQGDSLSEIADSFGVSVNTILWANDITNAKSVKPGDTLIILPVSGLRHTVAKGETLSSLAKKYGADMDDIAAFNGLAGGAVLAAGEEIIIPGGELSAATTKVTTKKTTTTTTKKPTIKQGGGLASVQKNPYKGGSGTALDGFFGNPVPGALLTQTVHGWNGVDLAAPNGTPIYAAAGGTVIVSKVGGYNGGYGNYVVIDHGNGTQTLYAHMSTDSVSIGEAVSKGERIGTVGITGEATGYHLHFEVRGAKNPYAGCAVMSRCSPE